jgi:hypothetical protein
MNDCPEIDVCRDRRTADAEMRGAVLAKLDSIEKSISALWNEMQIKSSDIKTLYFRIGIISGGTSLIVSLIVSFITKGIK